MKHFINDKGQIDTNPLYYGGKCVINPTEADYLAAGYHEYIPPIPEPILPTIEELVESKLRERYTINQEFEVQRKRETDPQSFAAYYDYVEECIEWANEQAHREEHQQPEPPQPENK